MRAACKKTGWFLEGPFWHPGKHENVAFVALYSIPSRRRATRRRAGAPSSQQCRHCVVGCFERNVARSQLPECQEMILAEIDNWEHSPVSSLSNRATCVRAQRPY
ncbi:unnamed protein product [Ectocarpus sp. 6 AP-2014]